MLDSGLRVVRLLRKLTRGSVAMSLTCLFAFANLAPLVAQAAPVGDEMPCCKNHRKACCRKPASAPTGPAFSSRPCAGDCAKITLGGIAFAGLAAAPQSGGSPSRCETEQLGPRSRTAHSIASAFQLHQRPPPFLS